MTASEVRQWSVEVPQTARRDRGNIRRRDPFSTPQLGVDGCRTMYEAIRRGGEISPLGPCLGFRAVSSSGYATPFVYSSYTECIARVNAFAAGLDRMGLVEENEDGMVLLGIYMKNCMEWVLAEHGIYTIGGATVPFYDTLGPDTVQFILHQTNMATVVTTRSGLPRLCEAKRSGECPKFRAVILVDGVIPEAAQMAQDEGLEVVSFAKVEAVGAQLVSSEGHKHRPPSGKDVATFCYTSGTTGNPKGALITHENFLSAVGGFQRIFTLQPYDRYLSYLPLAHIMERTIMSNVLLVGGSVGFYRGDPLFLIEDLQALRPTFFPAAPRVLNKIHDKIQAGITAAGGLKKKLFDAALAAKSEGLRSGHLKHALYDRLIFNKVKKALGMDHIRILVSGSAPLSENVMTFFRCMLGVPVLEGYGQTEGTANATASHPDDISTVGHVGGPTDCVEIVLVDVPEMGYLHTDTSHRGQPCRGRGEIWVRGPNIFNGYYKEDEKTRETLDEEGWLHSGDIGLWTLQGQLQIIDRKKNLFKLSQGEYVAPEKIENVLMRSPLIGQCFVYGDTLQSVLVAVVVPDEEPVRAWAAAKDSALSKASMLELCRNEQLKSDIMVEIRDISKSNGLQSFEVVKAIHLDPNQFTPDNGLTTPTFKLKRQQLRDKYEKEISEMYAKVPRPSMFPTSKL